ncbi:LamG-like jellyroll fold domain-containing protein [Aquipuribacter hungaricus]|uniref:LamG-like jellyroll fold domain-containing protein n=1 Tax=Aquipuribacter hungaricus TaxID=545624 RepID=A0ABV7WBQ8_9MICO
MDNVRRTISLLLASVLVTAGLTALAAPALALQGTVPGAAATSWQTNGTVRAIAAVGGVVYVGGDFTAVRPPGAAPGTNQTTRNRLAAFDAATGALITGFNPDASATVRSLTVSPDGSRLYVGGDFTTIAGQTRNRLAAFSASTRALLPWAPAANGRVSGIAVQGTTVWVGGYFTRIGTTTRSRVAALDATSGALRPFTTNPDNVLYDIAVSPQGDRLYLAGAFLAVNGDTAQQAAAVVDATTGQVLPLPAAQEAIPRRTPGCIVETTDIAVDSTTAYYSAEGTGGGCFDGTFAAQHAGGTTKWISRCLGATQGVTLLDGVLYTGSHAHDCSGDRSFDPDAFTETGWSRGLSRKLLARGADDGALESWYPNTNGGAAGGLGPRTLANDGSQVFVGGEFTTVNGVAQQGFTRFSPAGPTARPSQPAAVRAIARGDGKVSVFVQSPTDNDDVDLVVRLYRSGTTAPIATADVHSLFWRQPVAGFEDTGLAPGTSVTYSVEVAEKNGTGVSPRTTAAPVTVLAQAPAYQAAVAADSPSLHWRLGEPAGPALSDASPRLDGGTVFGAPAFGQEGATADGDRSVRFDGASTYVSSEVMAQGPSQFSVEAWFSTTSTAGGKIIGFGDSRGGLDFNGNPQVSGQYDKQVYMTGDGRLVFGVYVGGTHTIASAPGLNDGAWHHVVGTQGPGGMVLYVDGVRVGRNGQAQNQGYPGVWRIGGDSLGGWPDQPPSAFFAGRIDEVAVYGAALPASSVAAHYSATGRTPALPPAPTDAYGASVVQDGPSFYWRLDGAGGATAADSSGMQEEGVVTGPVTFGVEGALEPGRTAARFGGAPAGVRSTSSSQPTVYSAELWTRTTTTTGGKLVGFGNAAEGNSGAYDKHVYMRDDGRLVFGVYVDGFATVVSDAAYNDGQWHHVVATQGPGGMRLYVDNQLVGSNPTSANQAYQGFWRVGGDNLGAWPDRPSSDWYSGDIDEVAVYDGVLAPADVDAHYRASGRTGPPDTSDPTVAITSPAAGAEVFGPVTVRAQADDDRGVVSVRLLVDGAQVAEDATAPYELPWSAVAEGEHVLTAVAADAAGNSTTSAPVAVVVPEDTTAPAQVQGLSASDVTASQATLAWTAATDDRGVAGYVVLRDGAELPGTTATTGRTDTGLSPSTTYGYQVVAVDAAGNRGAASAVLQVTTASSQTVVFSDAFGRADGPWGAPWQTTSGNGSATVASGAGRLAFTSTSGAYARATLALPGERDTDTLLRFRWTDTSVRSYLTVFTRGSGGWRNAYRPQDGLGVELSSWTGAVAVQRAQAGGVTTVATVPGAQQVSTAPQMLRLRVVGDTVMLKVWPAAAAEPQAWTTSLAVPGVAGPGQLFLSSVKAGTTAGAAAVEVDDVVVTRLAP